MVLPLNRRFLPAVTVVLLAIDFALASYAVFKGPFPIKVTLGTPLAYRNIYLHVPIAVSTYFVLAGALLSSIAYLRTQNPRYSKMADAFIKIGLLYGAATLLTGSAWASESWGTPWNWDPKQTAVLLLFLAYLLYFPLKNSINDPEKRDQIAASYAIASFALVPLAFLASRLLESLHPTVGAIGEFAESGAGGILLGPRVLLMTVLGILLALGLAGGGFRLPRLAPAAILVIGLGVALVAVAPLMSGDYYRVASVQVNEEGQITSLELSGKGWVNLEKPVNNPIIPAFTPDGQSTLLGHLVRVSGEGIQVLPHWSTPYTFAIYSLMLATALFLNVREASRTSKKVPG